MPDRIFAAALAVVTLIYGALAFFVISAPFQYDPLGPEAWPRLLSVAMLLCLIGLLWRPATRDFDVDGPSWARLALVLALLVGYAVLFQPLGFILSTALFAAITSRLLGAAWPRAALFGVLIGAGGYLLCVGLLDLNLPAGPLPRL
ncbi:tripartite tricarboxylate transporter TctB family protein [Amaricoccus solimangrovi]|uniref:Tripartite tricarboxylate transporter TctB family protein n=1 Tax=Amaricoccus solimangrovi TaxID=2589815 RepID=A0A501WSQ0_9RHOB|nr:tripartite tricarboxylate transporter TctB family protein [Amaricoccus solimangrovi]TPE52459.1 tripartite tricarboxylate transporter TctB family protein [Amaricoccus solimangrovi]